MLLHNGKIYEKNGGMGDDKPAGPCNVIIQSAITIYALQFFLFLLRAISQIFEKTLKVQQVAWVIHVKAMGSWGWSRSPLKWSKVTSTHVLPSFLYSLLSPPVFLYYSSLSFFSSPLQTLTMIYLAITTQEHLEKTLKAIFNGADIK